MAKGKIHPDVEMLQIVAEGLKHLLARVVFVGGSTTTLYIDDPAAPESIATEDIDCVIRIESFLDMESLERELRSLGFKHGAKPNDPICRWTLGSIPVDIMPSDRKFLGFSNLWYPEGIARRENVQLPNGAEISIFSLPYFVASKIEACKDRGGSDLRFSQDFEDLVLVISGNSQAKTLLLGAESGLRKYLLDELIVLFANPTFKEGVQSALYVQGEGDARASIVVNLIHEIIEGLKGLSI